VGRQLRHQSDKGAPIRLAALAKLIEQGTIENSDDGPRLTVYGKKCFVVMEWRDGEVPELEPSI
jgi:hypothetical protein